VIIRISIAVFLLFSNGQRLSFSFKNTGLRLFLPSPLVSSHHSIGKADYQLIQPVVIDVVDQRFFDVGLQFLLKNGEHVAFGVVGTQLGGVVEIIVLGGFVQSLVGERRAHGGQNGRPEVDQLITAFWTGEIVEAEPAFSADDDQGVAANVQDISNGDRRDLAKSVAAFPRFWGLKRILNFVMKELPIK
jgi:hypothetical protein